MSQRGFATLLMLVVTVLFAPIPVAGQGNTAAGETWSPSETAWGDPDLQGTWTNTTTTPLQRPTDLAGKEFLTIEELAARDREVADRVSLDNRSRDETGAYNEFWMERGRLSRRTSLIVDPPDGRLPSMTPAEQGRQSQRRSSSYSASRFDSWEDFNKLDRCITRGMPGAMMPGFYNHNYQILQTPDYVAILVEMIHDVRIIPLDGRGHLAPTVRQWLGDARGHWDGNTLVVETTNFTDKIEGRGGTVFGGDEHLRVVERLTRVSDDTIDYELTVIDPTVWNRPWTASLPMAALEGPVFEYACHEGNYALGNILSGARVEEKAAAQSVQPASR